MKYTDFLVYYRLEIHSNQAGTEFFSQVHDADFDKTLWDSPMYPTMEEAYAAGREEWLARSETEREAAVAERTRRDDYVPPTQQQTAQENGVFGY